MTYLCYLILCQLVRYNILVQDNIVPVQRPFPEQLRLFWLVGVQATNHEHPNGYGLCKRLVMTLLKSRRSVTHAGTLTYTHTHSQGSEHTVTHTQEEWQRGSQGTRPWGITCHRVCVCRDVRACVCQGSCRQSQSCIWFQLHTYRRCVLACGTIFICSLPQKGLNIQQNVHPDEASDMRHFSIVSFP